MKFVLYFRYPLAALTTTSNKRAFEGQKLPSLASKKVMIAHEDMNEQ